MQSLESKVLNDFKDNSKLIELADFMYNNRELMPQFSFPYVEKNVHNGKVHYQNNIIIKPSGIFAKTTKLLDEMWLDSIMAKQLMVKRYT